jgi:hypothetical protein
VNKVSQATRAILRSFTGWTTFCAEERGWSPVQDPLSPGVFAQATDHATDWLFLRGWEWRARC